MLIANPIYDAVFKYLLEDVDIARGLLSAILDEAIEHLEVKPQEMSVEAVTGGISIFRLDFKAIVRTPSGELKKMLIELQKAKHLFDVMRFRRYLGNNYLKEDEIRDENGEPVLVPLPIVTIYFLGFKLANVPTPVLKVNRVYKDIITGEVLDIKEQFVELLSHDSYTIQIPRLRAKVRTRLEKILLVFSQEYKTEDKHKLNFQGDVNDPLVQKMVEKLNRAIASEELRRQMDAEDEIERIFDREIRKVVVEKNKEIEEERKAKEDAQQLAEEERKAKEDAQQLAEEERKAREAAQLELEALRKRLEIPEGKSSDTEQH
jgi:hypothetical protein